MSSRAVQLKYRMKKILEQKIVVMFIAAGLLAVLPVLSSVIGGLTFRPLQPFSFDFGGLPRLSPPIISAGNEIPLWKYLTFGVLLLLLLAIFYLILDPELRKRIFLRLVRFIFSMIAFWFLLSYLQERGSSKPAGQDQEAAGPIGKLITTNAAPPVFSPPVISPWLILTVSFMISLVLILTAWYFYSHRVKPVKSVEQEKLARAACEALVQLGTDHAWDEAIIQAYVRMSEAVLTGKGLVRQTYLTPGEFAEKMEHIGIPRQPVQTLTELFEAVRYGAAPVSKADHDRAELALTSILNYCMVVN